MGRLVLKAKVRNSAGESQINKPLPLNREYISDPNIKTLKRKGGLVNHGSTLRADMSITLAMKHTLSLEV